MLRAPREEWVARVVEWLDAVKKVSNPNGNTVLLANPEEGSIVTRALHLIASTKKSDLYKVEPPELRDDKARTVFLIPKTVRDYQVKAMDGNYGLAYFRRYSDGTLHMVITEAGTGEIKDHKLIAQRGIRGRDAAEGFVIVKVRDSTEQ